MDWKIYPLSFALFFGIVSAAAAHQPRITMDLASSADRPIVISEPDVSQAFYGELQGTADYYSVKIDKTSDFFLSILAPKGGEKDFDVSISVPGFNESISSSQSDWPEYYEEYGGDTYLQGPEHKYRLIPENYLITVTSKSGQGKYALVVGQKESFPLGEAINALVILPQLKVRFFNQPSWTVFDGKIYRYFALGLIVFLVILSIVIVLAMKWLRQRKMKETLSNF